MSALSLGLLVFDEIKEGQIGDEHLCIIKEKMKQRKEVDFKIHDDGRLRFKGSWCIPQKCSELKRRLMDEGHNTSYYVHPGGTSWIHDDGRFRFKRRWCVAQNVVNLKNDLWIRDIILHILCTLR